MQLPNSKVDLPNTNEGARTGWTKKRPRRETTLPVRDAHLKALSKRPRLSLTSPMPSTTGLTSAPHRTLSSSMPTASACARNSLANPIPLWSRSSYGYKCWIGSSVAQFWTAGRERREFRTGEVQCLEARTSPRARGDGSYALVVRECRAYNVVVRDSSLLQQADQGPFRASMRRVPQTEI